MYAEDVRQLAFGRDLCGLRKLRCDSTSRRWPWNPGQPYEESKLQIESALPWYENAFGLRWAVLRYFNVSAAEPGLGENVSTSQPRRIRLLVFGADFATPDGTAVQDYVMVYFSEGSAPRRWSGRSHDRGAECLGAHRLFRWRACFCAPAATLLSSSPGRTALAHH